MTLEAHRIAIGEHIGWQWHGDRTWVKDGGSPYWKFGRLVYRELPDFPNDLNAMAVAEDTIWENHELAAQYCKELDRLACPNINEARTVIEGGYTGWIAHATASQKAEAFVMALKLSKE